jgi:LPXTG-motif cell wall-anchored protein
VTTRDDDRRPGFLASLGGYLRPGPRHTAREGAAASSGLAGAGVLALLALAVVVARRRRRAS